MPIHKPRSIYHPPPEEIKAPTPNSAQMTSIHTLETTYGTTWSIEEWSYDTSHGEVVDVVSPVFTNPTVHKCYISQSGVVSSTRPTDWGSYP